VMFSAAAASVNDPALWPAETVTVPVVLRIVSGSVAARGPTVNGCGLEPVKVLPESTQSRFTSNVAVPSCFPFTVILIVIALLPVGVRVVLLVGTETSTTATLTSLANVAKGAPSASINTSTDAHTSFKKNTTTSSSSHP